MVQQKIILLVDDNEDIRLFLKEALVESGYQVLEAQDGLEAKDFLNDIRVDLVLTDVIMPRMTGMDLVDWVVNETSVYTTQGYRVPIILMTDKIEHFSTQKAQDLGVLDFLPKPFGLDLLLASVKSSLTKKVN